MDFLNERSGSIHHIEWNEIDKSKYYVFGPVFQLAVRLIIYPPMLVKTRIQMQRGKSLYSGTFDAFRKIIRYEGFRGLYKGFGVNTLFVLSGQVYISTYEVTRVKLRGFDNITRSLIAGMAASLMSQTITVPVDVVSQLLMLEGQRTGESLVQKNKFEELSKVSSQSKTFSSWRWKTVPVMRELYRQRGLAGFYKGYLASLSTYAPSSAVWWGSYNAFTQVLGNVLPSCIPVLVVQGMSGPAAATVAAVLTNPIDLVRTRLQIEGKSGVIRMAQCLYREEGLRALHKGLTARLSSSVPSGFIIAVSYETVKRLSLKEDSLDNI